jgi:hypothetical protein
MTLNTLPSGLQAIIQGNYLERAWQEALVAKLGYRAVADREMFPNKVGELVRKTRAGLRPAMITAISAGAANDLTSGLTASDFSVEQYDLTVAMYADMAQTNVVLDGLAIESTFMKNAMNLAEQATRSIDTLARNALFTAYSAGNTVTKGGGTGAAVPVDDARGFTAGMTVTINGNPYTVSSVAFDGTNASVYPFGKSGTLTLSATPTAGDVVAGKAVVASTAAAFEATTGKLTAQMILDQKAQLESNNVPTIGGSYNLYIDPVQATGLYSDTMFQNFLRGQKDSPEYKDGIIAELLGVKLIRTNQTVKNGAVRQAILVGQGALVEGVYTNNGYAAATGESSEMITMAEDIAHITRGQLDALQQWVTQTWCYIGGFVAPTDTGTNATVLPSATNAALKRAAILQSA